jgi:hypothetical protein
MWNTNYEHLTSTKKDPSEVLPADKSKVKDDAREGKSPSTPPLLTRLHITIHSRAPPSHAWKPHRDQR